MTAMKLIYDLQVRHGVPALTAPSPGSRGSSTKRIHLKLPLDLSINRDHLRGSHGRHQGH